MEECRSSPASSSEFDYAAFIPEQPRQVEYDDNRVRIYAFAGLAAAGARTPLALVPITLVGFQSLFLDESLIEIKAVAVVSQ